MGVVEEAAHVERSALIADADEAGLELVACPALLEPARHIFVLRGPL